ncbi:hypothetical protein OPV22_007503 [Ensete ventricosum]|uniref:Protein kinase domain-containing protein n=1 Tax=Ensete ventricosum TaxID=4639 RepID=A0AAV8QEJ3_ENSVE|nr:hypothetical protein OPV22_007503 [Ensete ventricosum]
MVPRSYITRLLTIFVVLVLIPRTHQLQSSQAWSLLRIRRLLNYPPVLSSWNASTDFCNADPNPYLTVVCYEESITQLHISGSDGSPPLPLSFSIDSFFTTLTRLPNLKVLSLTSLGLWGSLPPKISRLSTLEIVNMSSNYLYGTIPPQVSSLRHLQTLILDHNMFAGQIPDVLSELSLLAVLNLQNNTLSGPLPQSISGLQSLRVLVLSSNSLSADLPDLSGLTNLQVLDLENNYFGPQFPRLQRKVVTVVLRKNRFGGGLPADLSSYYLLQRLDVSSNKFVGPFLPSLLSLPSIRYLNIAGNRFTGMLFQNTTCNDDLKDQGSWSASKLILPDTSFGCGNVVSPRKENIRRGIIKRLMKQPPRRIVEHASSGYSFKLLADARYISQTMKLGALGIPSYRSFSVEELEAASNNFEPSSFMGEGSHGQIYRGRLKDGSLVAIRCLKLKKGQISQNFSRHIELISKLRHRHLVSALGHCFEYNLDDSSVSRLFLIFEYVSNGTLRSNVSEGDQRLTWIQRLSAAIGVVKGIQFLHGGIMPGLFPNDLKVTNIFLDQNLVAKISSYNLPVLAENMITMVSAGGSSSRSNEPGGRRKHLDKIDIYDFGIILLEIVSGRPITLTSEVHIMKDELQESILADGAARRSLVDHFIRRQCCDESLKTVMEICLRLKIHLFHLLSLPDHRSRSISYYRGIIVGCFDPGGNIVIHVAVGIVGSILVVGFAVFFAIRRGNLQEE